jgi:hypothetical protein
MKNRLSKLQKWILINAYKKVELKDNSNIIDLDEGGNCSWIKKNWDKSLQKEVFDDSFYWDWFFRVEILMNYYNIKLKKFKDYPYSVNYTMSKVAHLDGTPNKYQVVITRTLKNLQEQELIEIWTENYDYQWQGIKLTDNGKDVALKLIEKQNVLLLTIRENP